jgi:hypothetical protein
MPKKKGTPLWLILLKLVVLVAVMIGGTGYVLHYVADRQKLPDPAVAPVTPSNSWGIANDSPMRPKR